MFQKDGTIHEKVRYGRDFVHRSVGLSERYQKAVVADQAGSIKE